MKQIFKTEEEFRKTEGIIESNGTGYFSLEDSISYVTPDMIKLFAGKDRKLIETFINPSKVYLEDFMFKKEEEYVLKSLEEIKDTPYVYKNECGGYEILFDEYIYPYYSEFDYYSGRTINFLVSGKAYLKGYIIEKWMCKKI